MARIRGEEHRYSDPALQKIEEAQAGRYKAPAHEEAAIRRREAEALGERLRDARKAAELSQQGLAERMSGLLGRTFTQEEISMYERGQRKPSSPMIAVLESALGRKIRG